MSDHPTDVVAVIPAYQAAVHVGDVVRETARHLHVVVVDDGSSDGTGQVAGLAGADVLRQEPNQGKGAALGRRLRLHAVGSIRSASA